MHTVKGGRAYRSTGRQKPVKGLRRSHQYSHVAKTWIFAVPVTVSETTREDASVSTVASVAFLATRTLALLKV